MEVVREGELPDILSLIFEFLSLEDLKSCRQVSHLWAVESSKKMLTFTKVIIPDGRNLTRFVNLVTREESLWMKAPPTSFYRLKQGPADNQLFWDLCGAHIRRLSLSNVSFQSVNVFLHATMESTPNLEYLHIGKLSFVDKAAARKTVEGIPPGLLSNTSVHSLACATNTATLLETYGVQILEHLPSLQKLEVYSLETVSNGGDELFQSLARIRRGNPALLNLKQVDIDFHFFEKPLCLLPALVDSGLHLEGITVRFYHGSRQVEQEQAEVTKKLIGKHADSLQELLISGCRPPFILEDIIQPPNNVGFPRLEKLHVDTVRRMRILRHFPNLRELSVEELELEYKESAEDKDIKLKVTKLNVKAQSTDLRRLAICFPNVEELKFNMADSDQFPLICELWPKLRSLWWDCRYGIEDLSDAVITGYEEQDVRTINRNGANSAWRPITVRKANITSLTNLENFVWTQSESHPNYCAAVAGVLELPKLKNLVLNVETLGRNQLHSPIWKEALHRFTNRMPPQHFGDLSTAFFD